MNVPIDLWKSAGVNFGQIGSGWTARWPFETSRRQPLTIVGTTTLAYAAGTGVTLILANYLDINGGASNRIVKLPAPSVKFQGTTLEIQNAGTAQLNIQDSAGVAVADIGRGGTYRFALTDTAIVSVQEVDPGEGGAAQTPTSTKTVCIPSVTAGDVDTVLAQKYRVIDAWCVNQAAGGAADTIQVKNGANAISDAMDVNNADQLITRAASLDNAFWDIAVGGTLRITNVSDPLVDVYVVLLPVA